MRKDNKYNFKSSSHKQLSSKLFKETAKTLHLACHISPIVTKLSGCHNCDTVLEHFVKLLMEKESRIFIGKWIREAQTHLTQSLLLASVLDTTGDEFSGELARTCVQDKSLLGELLITACEKTNMVKVMHMKSLLSGEEISKELNTKPGKIIGVVVNELIEWQIVNMENATRELAQKWLDENKEHVCHVSVGTNSKYSFVVPQLLQTIRIIQAVNFHSSVCVHYLFSKSLGRFYSL